MSFLNSLQQTAAKHQFLTKLVVAVILVVGFFILSFVLNKTAGRFASDFLTPYQSATDSSIEKLIVKKDSVEGIPQIKYEVFKTQFNFIKKRKEHFREVATFFSGNYYSAIFIIMISGIFLSILIFLIGFSGWSNTNGYVKTLFFVFVFESAFWGLFPNVFDQKNNFEKNVAKYVIYDNIQLKIFNLLSTGGRNDGKNQLNADSMITVINKDIIDNNNILITIDASKINMDDLGKSLKTVSPK